MWTALIACVGSPDGCGRTSPAGTTAPTPDLPPVAAPLPTGRPWGCVWAEVGPSGTLSESGALAQMTGAMVRIPAQTFMMGCTESQEPCGVLSDMDAQEVTVTRDWWIGATEVTGAWYEALMGSLPVEGTLCDGPARLTWTESVQFANRVSELAGLPACYWCDEARCDVVGNAYFCEGYRLPTEAEWEASARCGTDFVYAGSDTLEDVSVGTGQPVGRKAPNTCGLYDMSGNVAEWTQDLYPLSGAFTAGKALQPVDPLGDPVGECRIARGGPNHERVSDRQPDYEGTDTLWYDNQYGLRLVRTVEP